MAIPTSSYPNLKSYFPEQYSSVSKDQLPEIKDQQFVDARDPKGIGTHEKYSSVSKPEIKDKQGTINKTDHRMSFFAALNKFLSGDRSFFLFMTMFFCMMSTVPFPLIAILPVIAVVVVIITCKLTYDFLNSSEYLLTKKSKKELTADLEQLCNKEEEYKERLKKLQQQLDNSNSDVFYMEPYYKQKEIRFLQGLIEKTKHEIYTIERALKKFSEIYENNN